MIKDEAFRSLAFFQNFSPDQLEMLAPIFSPHEFTDGTVIFEQDSKAESLYIVVSGVVVVNFKPDDGPWITVARVQRGGVVGWSAALNSKTYTSSAIAEGYTQLLQVSGQDLRQVCQRYPEIGKIVQDCLAAVIVERVRKTHAQIVALLEAGLGIPHHT
jgi:CRP-like cAMP-binding protein